MRVVASKPGVELVRSCKERFAPNRGRTGRPVAKQVFKIYAVLITKQTFFLT